MADPQLPGKILTLLAQEPRHGCTLQMLFRELSVGRPYDIETAIALQADIINALTVLKAEHRAWPTGERWKLTSRGRGE